MESEQPSPGHMVPTRPRTETEVVMATAQEIVASVNATRIAETASGERIALQSSKNAHRERMVVLLGAIAIGGISAAVCFAIGRPDLGQTLALATLTGILGVLASTGRAGRSNGSAP